jgi:hypothetical protein
MHHSPEEVVDASLEAFNRLQICMPISGLGSQTFDSVRRTNARMLSSADPSAGRSG